MPGNDSEKGMF